MPHRSIVVQASVDPISGATSKALKSLSGRSTSPLWDSKHQAFPFSWCEIHGEILVPWAHCWVMVS